MRSLELSKYISEITSPKGSFWRNKRKSEFSDLLSDSPCLKIEQQSANLHICILLSCSAISLKKTAKGDQKFSCCSFLNTFWVIFFTKKYLLVGASSMLRVNGWVSEWVRDVCMSHQSDWIHYKQPIKFLVLKVNGMWEDLIPIKFRTAVFILL